MSLRQGNNIIAGLQDISGKANTDLSNVSANIDFVVESQEPTSANNHTWYRKYKSGWVEQGGIISLNSSSLGSGSTYTWNRLTFPVALSRTPTDIYISDNMVFFNNHHVNVDSTGMQIKTSNQLPVSYTQAACEINWRVSGMIAS